MTDFFNILGNEPGVDTQLFTYPRTDTSLIYWQTWKKPRGAKLIHMLAAGGGSSGGCGLNSTTTSGGGAGGGSGSQSMLIIPAIFVPDILYIQIGFGGKQPAALVSAAIGVAGGQTLIAAEPSTTICPPLTFLQADGGAVTGTAATATVGGVVGTATAINTVAQCNMATKGFFTFVAGAAGSAGGTSTTAGVALTYPTTGLKLSGGSGGGGTNGTTARAGGNITTLASFLGTAHGSTIVGGIAAVTSTPAGNGASGLLFKWMHSYGGAGGGSSTGTAGGNAGAGGNGGPGCGGGGAGGSHTTNPTLARPGNGGDGFAIITTYL